MQDLLPDSAAFARLSLTWFPLAVSLIALYFAAQTYYLGSRPYVGIVEQDYRIEQDQVGEPIEMVWRFVMKNTGTSPAAVKLSKNVSTLTRRGHSTTLPIIGVEPGSMILMPGQTADITGKCSNAGGVARVREVLDGAVVLRVDIQLDYRTLGSRWWNRSFKFEVLNRCRHDYPRPAFIMERGTAN